ncbi:MULTISPECIES: phosphomannomutase/phosphoglucomutase [Vibrio]|uniref:phosphomannomutase/phosphoglucomutase n=1 Tax=Vibrio TaxID=662 RepID=UPI0001B9542A|nr:MULTISPECIES: phosphomannomutase/phosphoglucomutase [Vibrio]EEX32788.1 phosphomannomutase [Vibrio coralliilyticus ATCC BAA-450]MCM5507705.1 phosphomannomutase/phosphoglucomutase [Vibrio sp. SCSIO 43169]MDE3899409.1 phosphomannomutase/phosphoglucomutase [Vibrio sp. CC007]QFT38912.1 Phosphomannomutase/phosphoglucomutase [Vibrio sp. THAF64]QGM36551.1 Phosphomannomutase/phosphoglucomutase [Vibrio sp. THAF191d]
MEKLTCFKAYDIRGKLEQELNYDVVYRIGRAFGQYLSAKKVVVGGDARATSEPLKLALSDGLIDAGVDVIDLGLTGTEEIYYAAQVMDVDGGIEITASHNPIDYNGLKLVRENAKPISGDTGLKDIQVLAELAEFIEPVQKGRYQQASHLNEYTEHLLSYIDKDHIKPLKLVVNSGNGAAGHVIDALEERFQQLQIPIELIKIHHEPDSNFPNGIPNPLLPENRHATSSAVLEHRADMGIAWDGDFDRCFLFDEQGQFIEGYYIVGLLADAFLAKHPGAKVIHDPRLTWNSIDIIERSGGEAVMSKTGHAFIKERMRSEDAVYGGEMSAHHYFRDFGYCDSGMIPWLLVSELICRKGQPLSNLVAERIAAFPSSGEINSTLDNPNQAIQRIKAIFEQDALTVDYTDGVSMEFTNWRFNLRSSNTEPVVRLNVESRADVELMKVKTEQILILLQSK